MRLLAVETEAVAFRAFGYRRVLQGSSARPIQDLGGWRVVVFQRTERH